MTTENSAFPLEKKYIHLKKINYTNNVFQIFHNINVLTGLKKK